MVRLESGEEVLALDKSRHAHGGVFNDAGDRMIYTRQHPNPCEVALCEKADDGAWHETQRWDISDKFHWVVHSQFSPGDGRYLLLVSYDEGDKAHHGRIAMLDTATGEEPAWSSCFRSMMLPPGDLHRRNDNPGHGVRWVTPPASQTEALLAVLSQSSDADSQEPEPVEPAELQQPLILQAAIDDQLYLIDVSAFITSFEQDGNFSLEQLKRLSDINPDAIPHLLKVWPDVVNFRDEETGDTVLHHCARTGRADAMGRWLSGKVPPAQLDNKAGLSALREAVKQLEFLTAKQMVTLLDPAIPLVRTECLTKDVVAISEAFPRDVVDFIQMATTRYQQRPSAFGCSVGRK
jgi:hypothetical protein